MARHCTEAQRMVEAFEQADQRLSVAYSRLGLIERPGRPGQGTVTGWRLSDRMSKSLRRLADKLNLWRSDRRPIRRQKDSLLLDFLQ